MFVKLIEPLWLSRNAVSAASRPVAIRTIDCRGARHVAIDNAPLAVDERLGYGVKVHRVAPWRYTAARRAGTFSARSSAITRWA